MNDVESILRNFALANIFAEISLDRAEEEYDITLRSKNDTANDSDEIYYPQFSDRIRDEARKMSTHYEIFYCLEKTIRSLISERLREERGENWWEVSVPQQIQTNAQQNMEKEKDSAISPRSYEEIDYVSFGELGEIIKNNWDIFSDTFNSQSGLIKVLNVLKILRGPIADCSPLADDEVVRLRLTLRDWFRLME